MNALQTSSKAQLLQQLGRSGRTDCGIHITMMSHGQYSSQVRSSDLMILRSLVAGRPFSRLPFLCPPHPMVQTHAKEKMFLHGILDTRGVTKIGHATACMDLPCEWAQFLYTCAERGLEDSATILIAIWHRQGSPVTQQFNLNHGHPDGDLVTSILAYLWYIWETFFNTQPQKTRVSLVTEACTSMTHLSISGLMQSLFLSVSLWVIAWTWQQTNGIVSSLPLHACASTSNTVCTMPQKFCQSSLPTLHSSQ